VIELCDAGYVYAHRSPWAQRALAHVDLTIDDGAHVTVIGANGSGKSTLAWLLAGVLEPTEGAVLLDGRPIDLAEGCTAMSFQHARLQLFRPTVASDVRFGTRLPRGEVDTALEVVGLDPFRFRDRRVDELSGGEQRRVALAGAIARRPRVLVLDEPLAGLDAPGRQTLVDVVRRLRDLGDTTVVSVTHDLTWATALGERAVILRAGCVVDDGSAERVVAAARTATTDGGAR
jgi:energy-coupling factor transport system ATP-binding protein